MNNRWSFVKRFGCINHQDFMMMGQQFIRAIREQFSGEVLVEITFYSRIPHSCTAPEHGVDEWVAAENKKLELAKLLRNGRMPDVPHDLFDTAANIQLVISAPFHGYTFGHMECKGLLPRHAIFYLQADTTNAPREVMEKCVGKYRPSKWWFGGGDGFECCHHVSVS